MNGFFFTDPILRAPMIGSMLICISAAMVGVLVFVRKRTLLGEALSHASYPGVTAAILLAGFFSLEEWAPLISVSGAFISALIGFALMGWMEKKLKVKPDAALGAIIALFFGIGVLIASIAQASYSHLYRQMQTYLFGQAATLRDVHIWLYSALTLLIITILVLFFHKIQTLLFDRGFARMNGIVSATLEATLFLLTVLTIVSGVRCVGVVLMSAMLIAPATGARQWTRKLSTFFLLSACFGALSAYLGVWGSLYLTLHFPAKYAVPTGPLIVLVGGAIALISLIFSPQRGVFRRRGR